MGAIGIIGFCLAGVTAVLMAWIFISRSKAKNENDIMARAIMRLYDKHDALEKKVLELRNQLNSGTESGQAVKKAPPRPVPPQKCVRETDSWADIPVAATFATGAALGANAIGAWASESSSDGSWDCSDCGGGE